MIKFKHLLRNIIKKVILFFLNDFLIKKYLCNKKFPFHNSNFLLSITVENLNENPNLITKYHKIFNNDFQEIFWNSKIGKKWHHNIESSSLINEYFDLIIMSIKNKYLQSVLDVGCGFGLLTYKLSRKFKECSFLGIDISKNAINYAKSKYTNENLIYTQIPLRNIDKTYDLIISINTIDYIDPNNISDFINKMIMFSNQLIIITSLRGVAFHEFLDLKNTLKITRYDIGFVHPVTKILSGLKIDYNIKKCGIDSVLINIPKL